MTRRGILGEAQAGHEAVDVVLAHVLLGRGAGDLPERVTRRPGTLLSLVSVMVNLVLRLAASPSDEQAGDDLRAGLLADYFRAVLVPRAREAAPAVMTTDSAARLCDLVLALLERREAFAPADLHPRQSTAAALVLIDVLVDELGRDRVVVDLCWLQLRHAVSVREGTHGRDDQ